MLLRTTIRVYGKLQNKVNACDCSTYVMIAIVAHHDCDCSFNFLCFIIFKNAILLTPAVVSLFYVGLCPLSIPTLIDCGSANKNLSQALAGVCHHANYCYSCWQPISHPTNQEIRDSC